MSKTVAYLAKFHANEDGSFTVTFPNFEGCITEGKNIQETRRMAASALKQWLEYLQEEEGFELPESVEDVTLAEHETEHWISVTING